MAITGLNTNNIEVGDEVLYISINGEPYMNGIVKDVIKIAGGPDRLHVLLDNGQYIYNNLNKFVKVWKMGIPKPEIKPQNEDRKSTRLNSSHSQQSRMPSSA